MKVGNAIGAFVLVAVLAGCGTPPKERFYALSIPEPAAVSAPGQATFGVAVGPVAVPDMVDRPQIVLRAGANRVELSELNRWAEPLKRALPRAIAASLAQAAPSARVYVASSDAVGPDDYRVRIVVERFESELGKGATIEASWSVSGAGSGVIRHGRMLAHESAAGPGYDELVAAHSAAAAAIGREIASTLNALKR